MLFVDRPLPIQTYPVTGGHHVRGFAIGSSFQDGKKKLGQRIIIETPGDFGSEFHSGFHPTLLIQRRNGRLWFTPSIEKTLQLLLISRPTETDLDETFRHGIGTVRVPRKQRAYWIVHTRGVECEDGTMSSWYDMVAYAQPGDVFMLNWSTHDFSCSCSRFCYVMPNFRVITLDRDNLYDDCEKNGIAISSLPFSVEYDPEKQCASLKRSEWRKL